MSIPEEITVALVDVLKAVCKLVVNVDGLVTDVRTKINAEQHRDKP